MQSAKCIEVYSPGGVLLFRAYLSEKEFPDRSKVDADPKPESSSTPRIEPANGEPMSNAQRRFLFRLYALKGVEGERAEADLKRELKVGSLKDITKRDASKIIDRMVTERGGNGHGSPLR